MGQISLMRELEATLREIVLPEPLRWLDDDVVRCTLIPHGMGGFTSQFKSWLVYYTPPTGPEGAGAEMYFWPIRFEVPLVAGLLPDAKEKMRSRVLVEATNFIVALDAGTVEPLEDGGLLP